MTGENNSDDGIEKPFKITRATPEIRVQIVDYSLQLYTTALQQTYGIFLFFFIFLLFLFLFLFIFLFFIFFVILFFYFFYFSLYFYYKY